MKRRKGFGSVHVDLLQSGVNAILPLPPGPDWDDRLMRLVNVPVRRVTRFKVDLALEGGRRGGEHFSGRALNLSVHGLLLESRLGLEVGEDLRLDFDLPGAHGPVHGTGTVIRETSPVLFGVELTSVEGDGRVRINWIADLMFPADHQWRREDWSRPGSATSRFSPTSGETPPRSPSSDSKRSTRSTGTRSVSRGRLAVPSPLGRASAIGAAASPGVIASFQPNQHYPSHEAYIEAVAGVMEKEYEAITGAGFLVQEDPTRDVADGRERIVGVLDKAVAGDVALRPEWSRGL